MNPRDPLSDVLRSWKTNPEQDPAFNSAVWARIQKADRPAERVSFPRFSHWTLPLAASIAVLLSGAFGIGAAVSYDSFKQNQRMAAAYARSIDPLQMTAGLNTGHRH